MLKLIIFAIIIISIYYMVVSKFRSKSTDNSAENFIQCDKCRTFISANETILKNGKHICKDCNDSDRK